MQQAYTMLDPSTGKPTAGAECLARSTLGQMGLFGSPLMFNGATAALQVNPNYPFVIQPIPNQGLTLALTSAPVTGSYMHFYRDLRQHITTNSNAVGQPLSYTVTGDPDFSLRDKADALLPTNAIGTLSYSSNGSWMLVDTPSGSFIRVNLATFDVLPFAPSLNGVGDYSSRTGITAISDDGQYAAVASYDFTYFRVYDLSTCTGSTNDNYSQPLNCQSRDYWPAVAGQLSGFRTIYSLRFINDDNISMTAAYHYQSGTSYDVAKFTVTAPGRQAHSLDYLALGDSYISGEGEFQYKTGTDTATNFCHQSPLSYPFLIGSDLFNQYNSIACSGAQAKDITGTGFKNYNADPGGAQAKGKADPSYDNEIYTEFEPGYRTQLQLIQKYQPRVVTLSIGGNDIGFGQILSKCIIANVRSQTCYNSYDERMRLVKTINAAFSKLQDTYRQILKNDPGVQLYVIGYPQVVTQGSCGLNVQLNSAEIDMAQNLVAYLDWTIEQAANSTGARYVDTQYALAGHRLCEAGDANIAMNGITAGTDRGAAGIKFLGAESYHPNVLGHQLIAQSILDHTNNLKQAMPTADPNVAAPKPTDPLAVALLNNYTNSGNPPPAVVSLADDAAGEVIYRTVGSAISIGGSYGLRSNTPYQVSLDDDSAGSIGSYTTDSSGSLGFNLTLPVSTATGYHTLSVKGTNIAGQTTEVYAIFYVAASPDDFDGDGIPNAQSQCLILPVSGSDSDSDGIDDACDPAIGTAPQPGYPTKVYLTGNTIYATRP
jgi:lysophospholipase L1-like esterase